MYEEKTLSIYAVLFNETNKNWTWNVRTNLMFIGAVEIKCNELLEKHGKLYLNDVYEMLGFPNTEVGNYVGWIRDNEYGDGYVSIDIADFRNFKLNFALDFNVDGDIRGY